MKPKGKETEISSCWALKFWQLIIVSEKNCWVRIQNIRLFSPIQTFIILPQRTQNSGGPSLSYRENHLKYWHVSRENSPDPCVHPLTFILRPQSLSFLWNRQNSLHWYANECTHSSHSIFHVLCKPEFWKASSNLIHNIFNGFN